MDTKRVERNSLYEKEVSMSYIEMDTVVLVFLIFMIAFRYQWNFSDYTNQALNRAIHLLFEKYNLFEQDITMEYMQAGRKIFTKKKRELISCHTGRRTFISRRIEDGADVYDVMSCTGHKKYETLKFYVDKFGIERKQRLINMINRL